MKIKLITLSIIFLCNHFLYAQDTLVVKKRSIIYIIPTSILGNMPDVNTIWLLIGNDYRLSSKHFLGASVGAVVYSEAINTGGTLYSVWLSNKTSGYNVNIEYKFFLKKKLYYSTNLFYQDTKTYRNEDVYISTTNFITHQYYVKRYMYAITPKIGFVFINKNNFFTDIGIGIGVKYIESKTLEKITPLSSKDKEGFTGKIFEYGSVIQPRFLMQLKIGYNF